MVREGNQMEKSLAESDELDEKKDQKNGGWKESKYSPDELKKAQDKVNQKDAAVESGDR